MGTLEPHQGQNDSLTPNEKSTEIIAKVVPPRSYSQLDYALFGIDLSPLWLVRRRCLDLSPLWLVSRRCLVAWPDEQKENARGYLAGLIEELRHREKTMKNEKADYIKEDETSYTNMKKDDCQNSNGESVETDKGESIMENGASYTSMNNIAEESLEHQRICKICLDADLCMVFFPCRHLVACEACSDRLTSCAVCRSLIRGSIKVNFM